MTILLPLQQVFIIRTLNYVWWTRNFSTQVTRKSSRFTPRQNRASLRNCVQNIGTPKTNTAKKMVHALHALAQWSYLVTVPSSILIVHLFIIPVVFYLFISFVKSLVDLKINRDVCKLAWTSRVIKKKKWFMRPLSWVIFVFLKVILNFFIFICY